jgi:hypothetical protein
MPGRANRGTLDDVVTSGNLADLAWPLVVLGGFGIMVLLLRWTFSSGHSLVERRPKTGSPGEYGLLAAVAAPSTMIEGEQLRLRLAASGIRANLVTTTEGPRLMVFDRDLGVARAVLKNPPPANGPGKLSP